MVQTVIEGAKLDVWGDAETAEDFLGVVESVIDESADEVTVWQSEFEECDTKDYRIEVFFDVRSDGLFVGDRLASELESELEELGPHPTVSYSSVGEDS